MNEMERKFYLWLERGRAKKDLEALAKMYKIEVPWDVNKRLKDVAAEQEAYRDAQMRATSPVTRAMADQMLADCLARKS